MVDQDVMKGPQPLDDTKRTSIERESKFARVKRMLTCQTKAPITYDEAKASVKARKRKERQESISSISQERKVIRSNSEERPIVTKNSDNKKDIRRVSSNEDFQKSTPLQNHNDNVATLAIYDGPIKISLNGDIGIDECEFEKRRSHERFSRPLVQRGRYNQGRKPKAKQFNKVQCKEKISHARENGKKNKHAETQKDTENSEDVKENEDSADLSNFLQLHQKEKERSPSPVHTPASPAIDLTTLHQQIDNSEPIPSITSRSIEEEEIIPSLSVTSNRLLSSPRNSVIITQRIYLDPDVPQPNSIKKEPKNPIEHRQKQLAKQINGLKKKIKKFDDDFEAKHGYRASHADKLNDKNMKKLCSDLSKLKKEQKQLQEDSSSVLRTYSPKPDTKKSVSSLKDTIFEIEKRLDSKRLTGDRTDIIEDLSNDQLIEEKISVQKGLLYLESVHGRPTNKEDKDLARPLYDRYRALKRMVARLAMKQYLEQTPKDDHIKWLGLLHEKVSSVSELATIHEHETMDFVSVPMQVVEPESEKLTLTGSTTDSDTDTSIGENLHSLTLEELLEQQKVTSEEKKKLRRSLKEFEADFETKTGRKIQKEDRAHMESVYTLYKKAKAKLRLLDALVGKQTQ